jgi:Flp pilus assembly protein TadG
MPALCRWGHRPRGQALVEFAIVVPVFIALIGGIIQFGLAFWAQNTLTQVVRDTGRWEATQQVPACDSAAARIAVTDKANSIAGSASLFGYSSANPFVYYATSPGPAEGVSVTWVKDSTSTETPPQSCPPSTNESVWYVTITIRHTVPTFFPGMTYLPGLGTCDESGCRLTLSSTAKYRMEPAP